MTSKDTFILIIFFIVAMYVCMCLKRISNVGGVRGPDPTDQDPIDTDHIHIKVNLPDGSTNAILNVDKTGNVSDIVGQLIHLQDIDIVLYDGKELDLTTKISNSGLINKSTIDVILKPQPDKYIIETQPGYEFVVDSTQCIVLTQIKGDELFLRIEVAEQKSNAPFTAEHVVFSGRRMNFRDVIDRHMNITICLQKSIFKDINKYVIPNGMLDHRYLLNPTMWINASNSEYNLFNLNWSAPEPIKTPIPDRFKPVYMGRRIYSPDQYSVIPYDKHYVILRTGKNNLELRRLDTSYPYISFILSNKRRPEIDYAIEGITHVEGRGISFGKIFDEPVQIRIEMSTDLLDSAHPDTLPDLEYDEDYNVIKPGGLLDLRKLKSWRVSWEQNQEHRFYEKIIFTK